MSAFGVLPFGTEAPWGGPGLISMITIAAVGQNELIAFFTAPPRCNDPLGFRDARNAIKWVIEPVDPAVETDSGVIVPPGERRPTKQPWIFEVFRDADDPTQLHLITVPSLEPGVSYDVTLAGSILGAKCEDFGGLATFRVRGVDMVEVALGRFAAIDTYRDWSNPYVAVDGQVGTGTWRRDEMGEHVLDDAASSLKKRITRRLLTETGGFMHLPDYGLTSLSKRQVKPYALTDYAVRIQEQLRREPDVRDVSVTASLDLGATGGGVVRFQIVVQPRSIGEVSFLVQVPAGGV